MVFSNLTFVCLFLPSWLAVYFLAPQHARNLVLVAASAVFYVWGGRIAILLIAVSIAANFALGNALAVADAARRHRLICWSVAGNLLILIIFKYTNFIIDNVNGILDAFGDWKIPNRKSRCRSVSPFSPSTSSPISSTSIAAPRKRNARRPH